MNHRASLVWNKLTVQGLTYICLQPKTKTITIETVQGRKKIHCVGLPLYIKKSVKGIN